MQYHPLTDRVRTVRVKNEWINGDQSETLDMNDHERIYRGAPGATLPSPKIFQIRFFIAITYCYLKGEAWYIQYYNKKSYLKCIVFIIYNNRIWDMYIYKHIIILYYGSWRPGPCLNINTVFLCMEISITKIRLSSDSIIFVMGIPILVRQHLYIETVGWEVSSRVANSDYYFLVPICICCHLSLGSNLR